MSHARLPPSNERWPNCAGSVREEWNYPDIPGEAAIDGTGSHVLLEMCLENNVNAIQYDQQIIGANHPDNMNGWLVGLDRIERVQMCLDYITRRVNELKDQYPDAQVTVESETKADPGGLFGRTDWWGTVDVTIICRHKHTGDVLFIETVDYKDGRGWVHVPGNTQLISYLLGKMRPYIGSGPDLVRPFRTDRVKDCRMTIVQPKTNPVIRYQCSTEPDKYGNRLTVDQIIEAGSQMNKAAYATDDPDAPLSPGKWCQWCKANPKRGGHCMAATDKSLQVVKNMSTEISTSMSDVTNLLIFEYIEKIIADPKLLTSEQLSELASAKDPLMTAFASCEDEIKSRIEAGETVPGYAMVPGRGSNKWNDDEDTIVKKLKAKRLKLTDIYPKKLASPAQILKNPELTDIQKKKIETELVAHVAGKLTLTKVAHDQDNNQQTAEMMFGDVAQPAIEQTTQSEISFF